MKVVINKCYGGFSLSPKGVKRYAELKGKECYFFKHNLPKESYQPLTLEEAEKQSMFWTAFTVPNPDEVLKEEKDWHEMTIEEREAHNNKYKEIDIDISPEDRSDPDLVKVVEELGDQASGSCARLRIVEIPDDVEYIIEEYDGIEHIAEAHRTWS